MTIRLSAARKKLIIVLALICVFFLTLGVVSLCSDGSQTISASAETTSVDYEVDDASDLSSMTNGYYQLTASKVEVTSSVTIGSGVTVTLDLNGNELAASTVNTVTVESGGSLTVVDSSSAQTGTISNTDSSTYYAIYNSGTLEIDGGTISGSYRGVYSEDTLDINGGTIKGIWSVYQRAGTVNMTGGAVNGSSASGIAVGIIAYIDCTTNISGGTVTATASGENEAYAVYTYSTLNVSGDAVIKASSTTGSGQVSGIYAYFKAESYTRNITISGNASISGTKDTGSKNANGITYFGYSSVSTASVYLTINGGTIYGDTYGLNGNGDYPYSNVTINGGSVTGGEVGYYHPEDGDLTVTGGSISGTYAGLQVCAGTVTVTGGTFEATADSSSINSCSFSAANKYGDGVIADGAAISVVTRSGYSTPSVTVTGGTFTSASDVQAVQAYSYTQGKTSASDNTNSNTVAALDSSQTIVEITGGTYSSDLSEGQYSSYCVTSGLATSSSTDSDGNTVYGITLDTEAANYSSYQDNAFLVITGSGITGYDDFSTLLSTEGTSSAITVWLNKKVESGITISSGYTVNLNLNEHSIFVTSGSAITVSSGATLTITGTGTVSTTAASNSGIKNDGTLYINGGTISASGNINSYGVNNSGTLYIYGGIISASGNMNSYGVNNSGIMFVYDGDISSTGSSNGYGVNNTGTLTVNGGKISGTKYGVSNTGTLTVNKGTINCTTTTAWTYTGINIGSDGTVTINDGTICGINVTSNGSKLTINDGKIGYVRTTVDGEVVITGGEFNTTYSNVSDANYVLDIEGDSVTITGGTFTGGSMATIQVKNCDDVTIENGTINGSLSVTNGSLEITGGTYDSTAATSITTLIEKGVVAANVALVADGNGSYTATVADVKVTKTTTDGSTEIAYTDGETTALEQAIAAIGSDTTNSYTITLGSDYELTAALTVAAGQTITLDLNGYDITFSDSSYYITNKGTLTIKDSSGSNSGTISGSNWEIDNYGSLTVESGTISGNWVGIIARSGSITVINGGIVKGTAEYNAIQNEGTLTVNDGTITGGGGIYNNSGTTTVNGGTITGNTYQGIYNNYGTIIVNDGTITGNNNGIYSIYSTANVSVYGGTITGTNYNGIYNNYGTVIVYDGYIEGKGFSGICSDNNNEVKVLGGQIIGVWSAIEVYYGKLTISGGTISGIGTDSDNGKGLYINASVTATITGGTIKGQWAVVNYGTLSVSGTETYIEGSYTGIEANDGTVTINGGTIKGQSGLVIYGQYDAVAYVNGGTIIGDGYSRGQAIYNEATLYVTGGTITCNDNDAIYSCGTVEVSGGTITGIDRGLKIYGGTATISENVVINGNYAVEISNGGTATINDGTINGTTVGVAIYGNGNSSTYTTLTVNGGTIYGGNYGISGNGTSTYAYTKIYINDGSITGGATGIYHPEIGTLTMTGGSVTGYYTGIQMCAGTLNISGGTVTATIANGDILSTGQSPYNKTGDGTICDGAAISIVNRSGYGTYNTADYSVTSVNITGGTFISSSGVEAVQAYTYNDTNNVSELSSEQTLVEVSGGSFSSGLTGKYSSYVTASGFAMTGTANSEGYYTLTLSLGYDVTVTVNNSTTSTEYETLKDAITAINNNTLYLSANDEVEIVLYDNISLSEILTINPSVACSITLNLNGYGITFGEGYSLTNEGTLTITGNGGSALTFAATTGITNNGTLTVGAGVTVANTYSGKSHTIANYGALNITGGAVSSTYNAIYNGANAKISITGGTVAGAFYAINVAGGYVTISGGYISASEAVIYRTAGTVAIDGGYFTDTTAGLYVVDGCAINSVATTTVDGVDYHAVTDEETFAATINGVGYADLQSAINAAADGDTIKVVKELDIDTAITVAANQNIILDLNGKTLTISSSASVSGFKLTGSTTIYYYYAGIINYGTLTITDSVGSGSIVNERQGGVGSSDSTTLYYYFGAILNTGALTIEKATIESANSYTFGIANFSGGTVNVVSGTVSGYTYGIYNYGGEVEINGGSVSGTSYGIYTSGSVTVEDGNISGDYGIAAFGSNAIITISKGTITGSTVGIMLGSSSSTSYASLEMNGGTVSGYYGIYDAGTAIVNGGNISGTIGVYSKGTVTIGTIGDDNSNITITSASYTGLYVAPGGTIILNSGTVTGCYGALVWGDVDNYGTFKMYGGVMTATSFGISGNGSPTYTDGTKPGYTKIYIYGGSITSTDAPAIYHPQIQGELYLYGGTITGTSGVEIRGGTVVINDDEDDTASLYIYGITDSSNAEVNTSGSTTSGMAIAIVPYAGHAMEVTVESGTFTGYYAIYEANVNKVASGSLPTIEIVVSGGTYTGLVSAEDTTTVEGTEETTSVLAIAGGVYTSTTAAAYVTSDFMLNGTVNEDGYYTLIDNDTQGGASDVVATIVTDNGTVGFTSLQAAINAASAAGTETTITLLKGLDENITITSGTIIIDLNGKTLTGSITSYGATLTITDGTESGEVTGDVTCYGGSVTIDAGTFSGNVEFSSATANITGGTFATDVSVYVATGYILLVVDTDSYKVVESGSDEIVATIGNMGYSSLQAAISVAANGDTVILVANTEEDITIANGQNITLNLNGKTLTNSSSDTITVEYGATLTIIGDGTVDNVTHGKAAIFNYGEVYLYGGTYTRSNEAGKSTSDNGSNSFYVINNRGTMVIGSETDETLNNVTVQTVDDSGDPIGKYSSLIENGWQTPSQNTTGVAAKLTINGGTFQGGLNTVKNDDYGELEINGGSFTNNNQIVVMNYNVATITGGTFTVTGDGWTAIWVNYDSATAVGNLTITGGTFINTNHTNEYVVYVSASIKGEAQSVIITGGTFTGYIGLSNATEAEITGGEFSNTSAAAYVVDGSLLEGVATQGGYFGVKAETAYVAQIGDLGYTTLAEAIANAASGDEITLLADVNESVTVSLSGSITLNLAGYSITSDGTAITVNSGAELTITGNGTISGTYGIENSGTLAVESGTIIGEERGINNHGETTIGGGTISGTTVAGIVNFGELYVYDGTITAGTSTSTDVVQAIYSDGENVITVIDGQDVKIIAYGSQSYGMRIFDGATVTIESGSIVSDAYGIAIYGSSETYRSYLNVKGGSITSTNDAAITSSGSTGFGYATISISDGTITSESTAIYLPAQQGVTTITGGTIKGITGVEIRNGSLTISNDATITATGTFSVIGASGKSNVEGAAIAITPYNETDVTVTIASGTFTGEYAVYECYTIGTYDEYGNALTGTDIITLGVTVTPSLTGGTYTGAISAQNAEKFISGTSVFNDTSAAAYVVDGYALNGTKNSDGYYGIVATTSADPSAEIVVATIGNLGYTSLQDAIDAAEATGIETTIILAADTTESVTISSGIIILDLNGNTISASGVDTITVAEGATLTVKDNTGNGSIINTSSSSSKMYGITNSGTLIIESGNIGDDTYSYGGIKNYATATICGGTIAGTTYAIYNNIKTTTGSLDIYGGAISGASAAIYNYKGTINVGEDGGDNNNISITGTSTAISNSGTLNVYSGTITTTGSKAISGSANIAGGIISGGTYGIYLNTSGKEINISGGVITGGTYGIYNTSSSTTISDGTIYGAEYAIYAGSSSKLTVTGGTIGKSTDGDISEYGIWSTATSKQAIAISGGEIYATIIGVYTTGTATISNAAITTTGNGTETGGYDGSEWVYGVYVNTNNGILTIKDGTVITATNGDYSSTGIGYQGGNVSGSSVTVTVEGGSISGGTYGLAGNGSYPYSTVTISGGSIYGGEVGYYHPESGTLTITGGTIEGVYSGLQVCAGTIEITGGTITATATADEISANSSNKDSKSGDGAIADGAAVSIINRDGYDSIPELIISGGTFTSDSTVETVQAYSNKDGNKFTDTWENAGEYVEISGGYYSVLPADSSYYADGYIPTTVTIGGTTYYTTIIGVEASVPANEEITYDGNGYYLAASGAGYSVVSVEGTNVANGTATDVGTYTVTLTLLSGYVWKLSDGTYSFDNQTYTVEIIAGSLDLIVKAENYSGTYDGKEHTGSVTVTTADGCEYSITYGTTEGTYDSTSVLNYTNVGTYTVYFMVTAVNHEATYGKFTVEITNADITNVSAEDYSYTYGVDYTAEANVTATTVDGIYTVTYSTTEGIDYTSEIPTFTDVNTYTVYFKISAANHEDAYGSFTVTIIAKEVEIPTAPTTIFTYNGNSQTYLEDNDYYTVKDGTQTDAKTYEVTVTLNNTTNYVWSDGTTEDKTYTWVIEKADYNLDGVSFGDTTVAYDGASHSIELTLTGISELPDGLTVSYSGNGTNVGEYIIIATFTNSNANYNDVAAMTAILTISANEVTAPEAVSAPFTYNGSEQTYLESTVAYTVTNGKQMNAGTYTVTVTLNTGYTWSDGSTETLTFSWTIKKATIEVTKPADVTLTYAEVDLGGVEVEATTVDLTDAIITYTCNGITVSDLANLNLTDAGEYEITYTVTAVNHNEVSGTFTVTIANATITDVKAESYTYVYGVDYTAEANVTATTVDGIYTVTYSTTEGSDYTSEIPTFTDVNTYTVYFKISAANYEVAYGSFTVEITKAENSVSIEIEGWTYGEKANEPEVTATYDKANVIYYSDEKCENEVDIDKVGAGTYYVKAYVDGTANYTSASATTSFVIEKAKVSPSVDTSKTYTYDGSTQTFISLTGDEGYTVYGDNTATKAGTYTVTLVLSDSVNYEWSSDAVTTYTWTIGKATYDMSGIAFESDTVEYDGAEHSIGISDELPEGVTVSYSQRNITEAGEYTITATFSGDSENYEAIADMTATLTITAKTVAVPTVETSTYTYDGVTKIFAVEENDAYTISGATSAANAGVYTVIVTLNANYTWKDGSADVLTYVFVINNATMTVSASGYSGSYDGSAHTGNVTVGALINDATATIKYGTTSGIYNLTAAPEYTEAGTYVVYYEVTAANYNSVYGSYTITITEAAEPTEESVVTASDSTVAGSISSDSGFVMDVTIEMNLLNESEYELTVTEISNEVINVTDFDSATVTAVYDITLTSNGENVTVSEATNGGKVTVSVAIPTSLVGQNFYIVHIHDGEVYGVITNSDYSIENGNVTFEVEHLSQFAFVAVSDSADADSGLSQSEIITISAIVGGTVAITALLALAVMNINRGKRRRN